MAMATLSQGRWQVMSGSATTAAPSQDSPVHILTGEDVDDIDESLREFLQNEAARDPHADTSGFSQLDDPADSKLLDGLRKGHQGNDKESRSAHSYMATTQPAKPRAHLLKGLHVNSAPGAAAAVEGHDASQEHAESDLSRHTDALAQELAAMELEESPMQEPMQEPPLQSRDRRSERGSLDAGSSVNPASNAGHIQSASFLRSAFSSEQTTTATRYEDASPLTNRAPRTQSFQPPSKRLGKVILSEATESPTLVQDEEERERELKDLLQTFDADREHGANDDKEAHDPTSTDDDHEQALDELLKQTEETTDDPYIFASVVREEQLRGRDRIEDMYTNDLHDQKAYFGPDAAGNYDANKGFSPRSHDDEPELSRWTSDPNYISKEYHERVLEAMAQDLEDLQMRWEEESKKINNEHRAQVDQLNNRVCDLEAKVAYYRANELQVAAVRQTIQKEKELEVTDIRRRILEDKEREMQSMRTEMAEQREQWERKVRELQARMDDEEKEKTARSRQVSVIEVQTSADVADVPVQCELLESPEHGKRELQEFKKDVLALLREPLSRTTSEKLGFRDCVALVKGEIESEQENLSKAQAKLQEACKELEEVKSALSEAVREGQVAKRELQELRADNKDLCRRVEGLLLEKEDLQNQIVQQTSSVIDQYQFRSTDNLNDALPSEKASADPAAAKEIESLRSDFVHMTEKAQRLEKDLSDLRSSLELSATRHNEALEDLRKQKEAEIVKLQTQLANVGADFAASSTLVREEFRQAYVRALEELRGPFQAAVRERVSLSARVRELEQELRVTKEKTRSMKERYAQTLRQVRDDVSASKRRTQEKMEEDWRRRKTKMEEQFKERVVAMQKDYQYQLALVRSDQGDQDPRAVEHSSRRPKSDRRALGASNAETL